MTEDHAPTKRAEPRQIDPVRSPAEIIAITQYERPAEQLRVFQELSIPARRLHHNTVCVLFAGSSIYWAPAANQPDLH